MSGGKEDVIRTVHIEIKRCCYKCGSMDKSIEGTYRCKCLGSCPAATLSEGMIKRIMEEYEA